MGEEIAREKTSQVLRDAVSILIGPISKVGIKQKETDESERKSSKVKRGNHSQSEGYDGQRELQASGRRPRPLELRSGQTRKLNHPYYSNFCVQNQVDRGETGNATPYQYLPVTPASTIALAKRPRYHESPLAVPESQSRRNVMAITTPIPSAYQPYPHQSPYSSMSTSSSPASMFLSPPQRPIIQRQSSFAYFSGPSHHNSMTSSPDILAPTRGASHFVPPSGQFREPCLEDVPQFGNDFDLFHEELLSDHSDRGDREVSISPYPLLQCFSNADRNEQSGEPYFGNDL